MYHVARVFSSQFVTSISSTFYFSHVMETNLMETHLICMNPPTPPPPLYIMNFQKVCLTLRWKAGYCLQACSSFVFLSQQNPGHSSFLLLLTEHDASILNRIKKNKKSGAVWIF